MKKVILILFILTNWSQNYICAQDLPAYIKYVKDPAPNDTTCINEIRKAKKDVEQGKIVLVQVIGFSGRLRYANELKELCKQNGIKFCYEPAGCIVIEGQTEGCYRNYMEKVIIDKYGIDFKEKLHKKADSIFLVNTETENNTIRYFDCDERPRLPSELVRDDDYIPSIVISEPNIKEKTGENGGWPFFDIGFTVAKDSTISGFYSNNFVPNHKENLAFKYELYLIAVQHIKEIYPLWVPGKINGIPVKTDNNVRIYLTKKE